MVPAPPQPVQRTALQLYRDCLRLVRHIAPGHSPKSVALSHMVKGEFRKGRDEKDPQKIEALKANAVRALSNYMLFESGAKDAKMSKAMDRNVKDAIASQPQKQQSSSSPPQKDN